MSLDRVEKTEEVYRRYAIVDEAMIREADNKMTEERRSGELRHNETAPIGFAISG